MAARTFAVTGATGHIGQKIVQKLEAQGHTVRAVSRRAGVDIQDVAALSRAFSGADAVFLMIPPDLKTPDLRRQQNDIGAKLAESEKASGVRRVVFLSRI